MAERPLRERSKMPADFLRFAEDAAKRRKGGHRWSPDADDPRRGDIHKPLPEVEEAE